MPSAHERFIHEELLRRCARAVQQVPVNWKDHGRIHPTLLIWPEGHMHDGEYVGGVLFMTLSGDPTERQGEVKAAAANLGAYGLLLTVQLPSEVRAIFESEHGTRTWSYPIEVHGDVQVLGLPTITDDAHALGIRWQLPG
jgi:hypothetical protein